MRKPIRVAVTGATGRVGNPLLFNIASGHMFGKDQPVILQLLKYKEDWEKAACLKAMTALALELEDCAFPLLRDIIMSDDPNVAFKDVDHALLVGAKPREKGMERADLLKINAPIFKAQGRALNEQAHPDVKVLVVGNPSNTNTLIALKNAPDLKPENFSGLMMLDHNRTKGMLAKRFNENAGDIRRVITWGNHSPTQYPDIYHATIKGEKIPLNFYQDWLDTLIPAVQNRGAEILAASGKSSAPSAANAVIDHMNVWVNGTPEGDWTSMAVVSDGSYGIEEGLVYGFPVMCKDGRIEIVQGLETNAFSSEYMKKTEQELIAERAAVAEFLP